MEQKKEKIKVVLKEYKDNLNQISQQVPITFAFLTNKNVLCHKPVLCKDYLQDIIYSVFNKKSIVIYGLTYNPENLDTIPDLDQMRLLIEYPDKENMPIYVESALKLLHHYEEIGQFTEKTKVYDTNIPNKNLKVFVGSKEWLKVPALISLYTMLIRLGQKKLEFKTEDELQTAYSNLIASVKDNDSSYLERTYKYLTNIVKYRKNLFNLKDDLFFDEYTKNIEVHTVHSYRGIMALCMGSYPGINLEKLTTINKEKEELPIKKKKELISIEYKHSLPKNCSSSCIHFALASAPPQRAIVSNFFTCRDYLNDYLHSFVFKDGKPVKVSGSYADTTDVFADFNKLRLVLIVKNSPEAKERVFFAKKMLNIVEKELGFTSSKISTVKLVESTGKTYTEGLALLVTGPKEWMTTTHTLSFATFIFKSLFKSPDDVIKAYEKITTLSEFKELMLAIIKKCTGKETYYSDSYTTTYLNNFNSNIQFFINNFKSIFKEQSIEERFIQTANNTHGPGGILSFLQGQLFNNPALKANFEKVKQENINAQK